MRVCQLICVGVALLVSGCASWHRPDTVYRGVKAKRPPAIESSDQAPLFTADDDLESSTDAAEFEQTSPTLTPPVQGVSHRTGYRGDPEQARPVRTERVAPHPPGLGYIELPPPPDLE